MLTLYMVQRMDAKATDPAACASPEAATPPSLAAPTVAGAQTAGPVVRPIHGPFEDAQEQAARAIHRDIRTYGWAYNAGVSW